MLDIISMVGDGACHPNRNPLNMHRRGRRTLFAGSAEAGAIQPTPRVLVCPTWHSEACRGGCVVARTNVDVLADLRGSAV
jgi:hypothetical protein